MNDLPASLLGLSFDDLKLLCDLAETRNYKKLAIRRVGPNGEKAVKNEQANICKQAHKIEADLTTKLIVNEGWGIRLTPAGEQLVRLAKAWIESVRAFHTTAKNTIRIGGGDRLLQWLLLPCLDLIRHDLQESADSHEEPLFVLKNYPMENLWKDLKEFSLDLGLVGERTKVELAKEASESEQSKMGWEKVNEIEYFFFASARLLPEKRHNDAEWIVKNIPIAFASKQITDAIQTRAQAYKSDLRLKTVLECDTFPQAAAVVRLGMCGAVLPGFASEELCGERGFCRVPIPFVNEWKIPVYLLWNNDLGSVRPSVTKTALGLFSKRLKERRLSRG